MARNFAHWNLRYIKNRLAVLIYEKKNPSLPWLTKESIVFLENYLTSEHTGLELGSGRSTIWFAKKVNYLISIEHDNDWYEHVCNMIKEQKLSNKIDYRSCADLEHYAAQVTALDDDSLNFCLVDGKVMDLCSVNVIPKIKNGGLLVIDNINWFLPNKSYSPNSLRDVDGFKTDAWRFFAEEVKTWQCFWTSNGVSDTAIWVKPISYARTD